MSAAIMNPGQALPHRKPLPSGYVGQSASPAQQPPYQRASPGGSSGPTQYGMAQQQQQYGQSTRRTLSSATSSTSSTISNSGLQRAPTNSGFSTASAPRRSTSSRSTSSASPTSYVALMRKQKATVWCDRAQHEDPRILAAQRAAKMRAAMEVAGGHHNIAQASRTSTSSSGIAGGVRSKIRHHGAPKASTYTGGTNLSGAGVPMRLSASEVDEGDSDDDAAAGYAARFHTRTGSGRSSLGSGPRNSSYLATGKGYSNSSTPPSNHSPGDSMGDLAEEETPMPQYNTRNGDYFQQSGGPAGSGGGGSSSSSSEERSFGGVGGLPPRPLRLETAGKNAEDLRRRGSVDERTMTMGGGRLFVANPDLSD